MTPQQLHILQHALGVDAHGHGSQYRSHFVTGPGSDDFPNCEDLVAAGLMRRHHDPIPLGGDQLFTVTNLGREAMKAASPPAPKLSRGAARYRRFLAADDGSRTFIEWLRATASHSGC